jgi:hypothetical protein
MTRYISLEKFSEVFKPAIDRIDRVLKYNDLSPRHKKRLEKKLLHPKPETPANNPIESMVKRDPKVIIIVTPKEASVLKTCCALVRLGIVTKNRITQTKDTIEVLDIPTKKIDESVKIAEMKQ